MDLLSKVVVSSGASEYYGTMVLNTLHYADNSPVHIKQFLTIEFQAPAALADSDIYSEFTDWVGTTIHVSSNQIEAGVFAVSARVEFDEEFTFSAQDKFTISVSGDLNTNKERWLKSFVLAADQSASVEGSVAVHCAAAPDTALAAVKPRVDFVLGSQIHSVELAYGQTSNITLPRGDYALHTPAVSTSDGNVVAAAHSNVSTLSVAPGSAASVAISFDSVQRFGSVTLRIGALTGLASETLNVTLKSKGANKVLATTQIGCGQCITFGQLPASGTALVQIDSIGVNGVEYLFSVPDVALSNHDVAVDVTNAQVHTTKLSTQGAVNLPLIVTADVGSSHKVALRLVGSGGSYSTEVSASTQRTAFPTLVQPGDYRVVVSNFIENGSVHIVGAPATLTVASNASTSLNLSISTGANLHVRGFPSHLSFGGCADLTPGNAADFTAARAESIFIYAGVDGMGDATLYLADDVQTRALIELSRTVEAQIGDGRTVLPVIVSYTTNLSLGDTLTMLANSTQHAYSFGNYIQALQIANEYIDEQHPVPVGFVVNPDFLGACEQANLDPGYAMPVRKPLQEALTQRGVNLSIPAAVTEDIKGYVTAVNWLTRTIAPAVTFGWQVNLWGVGYSEWIYEDSDVAIPAQQTADYIAAVGAYSGPYKPDFLAVDRYEGDDLTLRAYINGYCYGPREWGRFWDFCGALSAATKLPIMPWQIPSGRIPNTSDVLADDFNPAHWGTAGSYLFGDPAIGSDYHNVNAKVLALPFPEAFPGMGANGEAMFQRSEPFDISQPRYGDFPLRGIFTVLLGGGATTGLITDVGNPESWVRNKVNAYYNNPVQLG